MPTINLSPIAIGEVEKRGNSYPPSTVTNVDTTSGTYVVGRGYYYGNAYTYDTSVVLGNFDTSSIPSNAVISSATLTVGLGQKGSADDFYVAGEWYNNFPIDAADYTSGYSETAFSLTRIQSSPPSPWTLTLKNPNNSIRKGLTTGIRIAMNGGQPFGENYLQIKTLSLTITYTANNPPTLILTSPANNLPRENLLGIDGNCEDTSKFTYTGGTAALDATRKTQGNNSIKVTKTTNGTNIDPLISKRLYPAVGDCYIAIADVYLENACTGNYVLSVASGITRNAKQVTSSNAVGFPATITGQFAPIIAAFQVTAVTTPGTSYLYPRLQHNGTAGQIYNADAFRMFKITQAEYDALPTNVDLATAQAIAAQYPYVDPNTNLTLSEGETYTIQGTSLDPDAGNVVTTRYKINNGSARAISPGVSDGSSPISFSKALTYRNKRLWDGNTDVVGADLAEGIDHTLTVWAEDDQGGKSPEVVRKFRVEWNRPPVISGADENLGTISSIPSINYSATDPEGQDITITEYIDGQQIRSFPAVSGQEYIVEITQDRWLRLSLGKTHQVKIRATDSMGAYSERVYTFIRSETEIAFTLNYNNQAVRDHFILDAQPTRVLVTLDCTIPSGATLLVEVCNNALDESPTWEDITGPVKAGRGYIFQNAAKTADQWAINIRVTIDKGTAIEPVLLNGFGGAFD